MKTVSGLFGGGTIIGVWEKIPAIIKYPLVFGIAVVGVAELNIDVNHALRSTQIFGGQGAQGEAQMIDPVKTRADMKAGTPVTGASALLATQVDQGDADAQQKQALARAATESIDDIRDKHVKGRTLTTTESFRLKEYEIKEQELRAKKAEADRIEAEARIKQAEATAAMANAERDKAISGEIVRMYGPNGQRNLYGLSQFGIR
jgi:hypothetical protein